MSFNGSGTFLINTAGQPVVSGTVISSTAFNSLTADLATGLSTAITKDGQTTVTANIPMSTYKFTGLGVGSAATDSANLSQVQSTVTKLLNSVSGADTITATASPTLAAYAAGQMFYFVAAGDNTTSVTLNIDSLGAKAVTRDGSVALAAADIKSGEVIVVVYDGTRFQVVSQLNSAGNATFANVSITSALNVGGVATFTNNPVLSGGTANGVLYLNGSKVATSGSALVFDGTNLGIGTASPGYKLTVQSAIDTYAFNIRDTIGNERVLIGSRATAPIDNITPVQMGNDNTGNLFLSSRTNSASGINFYTNAGTAAVLRATIDSSGNLGIGTASPAFKLHVSGSSSQFALISTTDTTSTTGVLFGDSASNTVGRIEYVHSDNGMRFYTNGTTQATLDSSGNLGLGVTPSAWASSYKSFQLGSTASLVGATNFTFLNTNVYFDSSDTPRYLTTAAATRYQQDGGAHKWFYAASGTAGNAISFTQAMTLTASGDLGIGTASPAGKVACQVTASGTFQNAYVASDGASSDFLVKIRTNETQIMNSGASVLSFGTSNTERARITSGGYFKASNAGSYQDSTGAYHELRTNAADYSTIVGNTNASPYGAYILFGSADPNNSTNLFLLCNAWNGSAIVTRVTIRSNGGLANYQSNNVDLSDARTKKDITPSASMWDKIGALEIVTYKYNDQTHDDVNVGVIAQQVESVEPVWVDNDGWGGETTEDGVPLKTVYTKDITFAAIKALQEAMARIETLEAKVTALESK